MRWVAVGKLMHRESVSIPLSNYWGVLLFYIILKNLKYHKYFQEELYLYDSFHIGLKFEKKCNLRNPLSNIFFIYAFKKDFFFLNKWGFFSILSNHETTRILRLFFTMMENVWCQILSFHLYTRTYLFIALFFPIF